MGKVLEVNGPIVTVSLPEVLNGEQVRLGAMGLVGEVIAREEDRAVVQVYESTESLRPGETAEPLGYPLSVELGPGLMGQIFDGIQRPLHALVEHSGDFISRGHNPLPLNREREWHFVPNPDLETGTEIGGGTILGTVQETPSIEHRILVPPDVQGELLELAPEGDYSVDGIAAHLRVAKGEVRKLPLYHRWPVRTPRPYRRRETVGEPLLTGQRVLDTFFPLIKGGKAAVPGPFGAGKTMVQQQIARWANADVVIYVGCGERGNELVDILETFPELIDPQTGRSLMERTLLVANTSNMPVVAREASIYVGVTLAEYYRDQGFDVVMVADSTSRWAEALREVGGRLGQMPVEEGYPAYLASRLAAFYERAGRVETLGDTRGSVTLIGAVSPPGGDFSEPVTSHTKELIQTFWALSKELADSRHYPAIDWSDSFSGYVAESAEWWAREVDPGWEAARAEALALLARADELARIVNLVGPEALSAYQRWELQGAALIKEGVLQQSALDSIDSYCSPKKQLVLLRLMLELVQAGQKVLALGVPVQQLIGLPLLAKARRLKSIYVNEDIATLETFSDEIHQTFSRFEREYGESTAGERV